MQEYELLSQAAHKTHWVEDGLFDKELKGKGRVNIVPYSNKQKFLS